MLNLMVATNINNNMKVSICVYTKPILTFIFNLFDLDQIIDPILTPIINWFDLYNKQQEGDKFAHSVVLIIQMSLTTFNALN